jgi:ABC-type antimicrobial peptide transport system permease subunit
MVTAQSSETYALGLILLGWFVVRVADNVLGTIAGVLSAVQQQAIGRVIGHLLYGLLAICCMVCSDSTFWRFLCASFFRG